VFPNPYRQRSACFAHIASTTFARNVVYAMGCELGIAHRSGSHECVPKCVLGLENRPDVVAVPNTL
jgi:gamma-glutamyl phosphate reductase